MKKVLLTIIMFLLIPFVINAEELEIKNIRNGTVLYSNGKMVNYNYEDNDYNVVRENIKKNYYFGYLTNDNNYIYHFMDDDSPTIIPNVKEYLDNTEIDYWDSMPDVYFIGTDDNLYKYCRYEDEECIDHKILIHSNVDKAYSYNYDYTVLFTTKNKELYALGNNYFGSKINDGHTIEEPIKILDNIVDFNRYYALDEDGNFYIFNKNFARPTIKKTNVKRVIKNRYSYSNLLVLEDSNNKYYLLYEENDEYYFKDLSFEVSKLYQDYILTDDNKLYYFNWEEIEYIDKNVIDMTFFDNDYIDDDILIYLKSNHDTYYFNRYYWHENPNLINKLYHEFKNHGEIKIIPFVKNVKTIKFAYNGFIILNDNSVITADRNSSDLVKINELFNNNQPIKVDQLYLSFVDVYDYTIGDKYDAFATPIPYNATNKSLVWNSSNTDVATVDSEGYVVTKGVGSTTITVSTADGTVSESKTINVYPKPSGIEITNGDEVTIGIREELVLDVIVSPENTIKKQITWELLDDVEYPEDYLGTYYHSSPDVYTKLPDNQRCFHTYKGGTYRVKVTTEDGAYSDIITINVVEKVSDINIQIPKENSDGYNAFIYLFENSTLQVTATVGNENANNKNLIWSSSKEDIAEVSQTGLITGKKAGRSIITVASEDGGCSRSFNVIVYDSNGNPEITGKVMSAPTINVKNSDNNTLLISWDKIDNAEEYTIYQSTDKKKWTNLETTTYLAYIAKGLTYGKTYYYKVKASNAINGKTSSVVSGKTIPNKVNLNIVSAGSNNIKLSWEKVNVNGYEVYNSLDKKNWTKITTITSNATLTYNNKSLKSNKTYYYKARAYKTVSGKKVYGTWSNVVTTKTAPKKPTLKVTLKDYNAMNVEMGETKGSTLYRLEKSLDGVNYKLIEEYPASGKVVSDEQEIGKTYYFRLKACNSDNRCSGWVKAELKQTTKTPGFSIKTSRKKVTITMSKVNGADGYQIYRATSKKGKYSKIKEFSSEVELLEYVNKTKKGKTYYYKVRSFALNELGNRVYSPYSKIKSIRSK